MTSARIGVIQNVQDNEETHPAVLGYRKLVSRPSNINPVKYFAQILCVIAFYTGKWIDLQRQNLSEIPHRIDILEPHKPVHGEELF